MSLVWMVLANTSSLHGACETNERLSDEWRRHDGQTKRKIRALIKTAISSYAFLRDNEASFATDYFATNIAWKPLHATIGTQHLQIHGDGTAPDSVWQLRPDMRDEPNDVRVSFTYAGMVDIASLLGHTNINPTYAAADLEPTKRALNVIISKCFGQTTNDMVQIGANKFFCTRGTSTLSGIGNGGTMQDSVALCTTKGYYFTVKASVRNVLLNINPCTSAFFNKVLVSDVMNDTMTFKPCEREGVLRGLRVRIELDRGNKPADPTAFARFNTPQASCKTVQGLGDAVEDQEFDDENGNLIKVLDHLQNTYHITIQYPKLPAVNLGSSYDPKWYAPEHLMVMPHQMYTSVVPSALTESMLGAACLSLLEAASRVDVEAQKAMGIPPTQGDALPLVRLVTFHEDKANLSTVKVPCVDSEPADVAGSSHQFGCPTIRYSNNEIESDQSSWNLIRKRFFGYQSKNFRTLVLVEPDVDEDRLDNDLNTFKRFAASNYRVLNAQQMHTTILTDLKSDTLAQAVQNSKSTLRGAPHLILLVLKNRNVEAYSRFKDLVARTLGCHSICMTDHIFGGGITPSMGNITMKANFKGAGSNHMIQGGNVEQIMADTLVLGADVTHPSGGSIQGCPSIAAIAGSVDNHAGRFLGSMCLQSAGKKEASAVNFVIERLLVMTDDRQGREHGN
ncbi:hypothetical protein E8E11_000595 [Didymella keratinophila]|nr:hypothetical protein E8E11_000595 [Didymella keratinophila]